MKNKNIILGLIVAIIVLSIFIIQNPFKKSETVIGELQNNKNTGLEIENLAPDFILQNLNGDNVQLSSFRGKSVVINFWATWCPPCREEFPEFEKVFVKNKKYLEILGVNLQEDKKDINKFLEEIPVSFTLLLDPNKDVKELYNVFIQPVTYFIDEEGKIVDKKFGILTKQEMKNKFSKLGIK